MFKSVPKKAQLSIRALGLPHRRFRIIQDCSWLKKRVCGWCECQLHYVYSRLYAQQVVKFFEENRKSFCPFWFLFALDVPNPSRRLFITLLLFLPVQSVELNTVGSSCLRWLLYFSTTPNFTQTASVKTLAVTIWTFSYRSDKASYSFLRDSGYAGWKTLFSPGCEAASELPLPTRAQPLHFPEAS